MANVKNTSEDYIQSFAQEMLGKFSRLNKLIKHSPSIGTYHEEIVKAVCKNFLSDRFSVKTGFIYKDSENLSAQVDLMIVDENSPSAYVFKSEGFAVVTPESVVAVIEVKTGLGPRGFVASIKNIESVKRLPEFPSRIKGLVFSYNSPKPSPERLGLWFADEKLKKVQPIHAPEAIYISKRNVLLHQTSDTKFEQGGKYYRSLGVPKKTKAGIRGENLLRIFLAHLDSACENKDKRDRRMLEPPGTLVSLLGSGEVIGSDQKFELGKGLV